MRRLSLRTICLGLCRFLVAMILSSLPAHVMGQKTPISHGSPDRDQAIRIVCECQEPSRRTDPAMQLACVRRRYQEAKQQEPQSDCGTWPQQRSHFSAPSGNPRTNPPAEDALIEAARS
jgi:hypothetical protein